MAQRPPGHAGRHRALGLGRTRRAAERRPDDPLGRRRQRIARRVATRPRDRPRRRAAHARAGRLPHAPGLRRPACARVRTAAARRQLRADRARRRRHPLDGGGHACRQRRTALHVGPRTRADADERGRDHAGDQVRLRPERRARGALPAHRAPAGPRTAADGAHHLPVGARAAAGIRRPRRRLHRCGVHLAAGAARRRPGRCGRRLLRKHRLHTGADAARVRGGTRSGTAGEAACRTAQRPRRRGAGRVLRRAVLRPPGMAVGRRRACHGRGRHGGRAAARRLLLPARDQAAADPGAARRRRADRAGQRPQPGLVAGAVAAADAEHGLHLLPHDARRSAARRHRARRTRAGPARPRHAGSRASAPTSSPGTWNTRTNWPTGSAATPAAASSSAAWSATA